MEGSNVYEPVDLASVATATTEVIDSKRRPPGGDLSFHGIPFRIAGGDEPRFVLVEPVVRKLDFVHRLIASAVT